MFWIWKERKKIKKNEIMPPEIVFGGMQSVVIEDKEIGSTIMQRYTVTL